MKKLVVLILLCALLGGCAEQFQGEGQGDDSSELVSNAETTTTTTTTQSTTSTTETSTYEPIEVEMDDPLAGFVPIEHKRLYGLDWAEEDRLSGPIVLAEDIPKENLTGTDADLFVMTMYDRISGMLSWFNLQFIAINSGYVIYDGRIYLNASSPFYTNMDEFIDFLNIFITKDYILSLLDGVGFMDIGPPFIEYEGKLYALDGARGSGAIALNGEKTFYKISETDTQAIYEVYYGYDPEFTGWEGARRRYVVLQKENGRWLVADGGFWMDLF
ncbi:MAG TPA: hypothetical protein VJX95_04770 [Oscillospiraceae bacterium]|nr:hypothetical protein [Oscillospiraceae bacterium]